MEKEASDNRHIGWRDSDMASVRVYGLSFDNFYLPFFYSRFVSIVSMLQFSCFQWPVSLSSHIEMVVFNLLI